MGVLFVLCEYQLANERAKCKNENEHNGKADVVFSNKTYDKENDNVCKCSEKDLVKCKNESEKGSKNLCKNTCGNCSSVASCICNTGENYGVNKTYLLCNKVELFKSSFLSCGNEIPDLSIVLLCAG